VTDETAAERRAEIERRLALPLAQLDRLYKVREYADQKARHPHRPPRGECSGCLTNFTLRADNCMREHKFPGTGKRCKGAGCPSLGLPKGYYAYF
jgi:hypothetical protein